MKMLKPSEVMRPPERQPDETFEAYKQRRKGEARQVKKWLKGRPAQPKLKDK